MRDGCRSVQASGSGGKGLQENIKIAQRLWLSQSGTHGQNMTGSLKYIIQYQLSRSFIRVTQICQVTQK